MCFFKHKTAYELRISDWSSDVCSSDLFDDDAGVIQDSAHKPECGSCSGFDLCASAVSDLFGYAQRLHSLFGSNYSGSCSPRCRRRSEERRVGKSVSVRVDLGGRRIIKKKKIIAEKLNIK